MGMIKSFLGTENASLWIAMVVGILVAIYFGVASLVYVGTNGRSLDAGPARFCPCGEIIDVDYSKTFQYRCPKCGMEY